MSRALFLRSGLLASLLVFTAGAYYSGVAGAIGGAFVLLTSAGMLVAHGISKPLTSFEAVFCVAFGAGCLNGMVPYVYSHAAMLCPEASHFGPVAIWLLGTVGVCLLSGFAPKLADQRVYLKRVGLARVLWAIVTPILIIGALVALQKLGCTSSETMDFSILPGISTSIIALFTGWRVLEE